MRPGSPHVVNWRRVGVAVAVVAATVGSLELWRRRREADHPSSRNAPMSRSTKWTPETRAALDSMWQGMVVHAGAKPMIARAVNRILANRAAYERLAAATGAPWWWIGAIHNMEGANDMRARIRDGKRLPSGADWHADALATLREQIGAWRDWSMPGALWMAERYNGLGYRRHAVATPYVWSGTPYYTAGKFVRDGVYDPSHVSKQVGVAPVTRALLTGAVV